MSGAAHKKAIVASLLDHFAGLDIDKLARLTDRQIHELYLHRRNKDGSIAFPARPVTPLAPEAPATRESAMADLMTLAAALNLSPEAIASAQQQIETKYGPGSSDR